MRQHEFDALPLMMTRSAFRAATGLSDRALSKLVADGRIRTFMTHQAKGNPKRPKDVRHLYPKSEAAKITGLVL